MNAPRSLSAEARGRLESAFGLLTAACVLSFIPWLALLGQSALCLLGLVASLLALLGVRGVRAALLDGLPAGGEVAPAAREDAERKPEHSVFSEPPALSGIQLETTPTFSRKKTHEPEAVLRRKSEPATPAWTEKIDWEEWVGKKLLQKAGLLIVLIGVVLLLKYSFDSKWIDELGRLALGTIAGIGLLAAGEIFRAKYAKWAQGFTGAGLAMLYLIIWAAHSLYPEILAAKYALVIPDTFAVCLYGAVTALGAAAAIRYRSPVIAGFALLGGYATPFLLGEGAGSPLLLAVYLAILSAGMLAVSWKTRWPWLAAVAFVLTQAELGTMVYLQPEAIVSDAAQAVIAAGFFVIFSLPPLLAQFGSKKDAEVTDILLLVLNGLCALTPIVDALGGVQEPYAGLAVLGFALFYALCAAAAVLRRGKDLPLVNAYLLGAIGLIALALEIEMGWGWVAAGWAPLSVAVLLLSVRLKRGGPWVAACALLGLSGLALLTNIPLGDPGAEEAWKPLLSDWAIQNYVVVACIAAWTLLSRKLPPYFVPEGSRTAVWELLQGCIALFVFLALSFEVTRMHVTFSLPLAVSYLVFASLSMGMFVLTGARVWFVAALSAQVLSLLGIFVFGTETGMYWDADGVRPFLHPWGLASLAGIGVTLGMGWASGLRALPGMKGNAHRVLLVAMALAQVWLHVTVEITHLAQASQWDPVFGQRVLALWWWIFAAGVLAWGAWKENRSIRMAAIALLAPPYLMAVAQITDGAGGMLEVALWTATGLGLSLLGGMRKWKEVELPGLALTAVTAALDMAVHLGDRDAGVLRSSYWTGIALLAIAIGFATRSRNARRLGMALFAAAALKLLLADLAGLEVPVRIGASMVTGLLMIGASYLYQRFDASMADKKTDTSPAQPKPRSRS